MAALLRDLRFAVRQLRRSPLFALAAAGTLALGVGANTAIFSVVDAVLLRPLPVAREERVMKPVLTRLDRGGHYGVAYHNFMRWRDDNHTFTALAAMRARTYQLSSKGGSGERLDGSDVSPSYFEVLGVEPARGRRFLSADAVPGSGRVAIVSHAFWQRHFGADSEVAGTTLRLDGEPHEVVGVMPPASPDRVLGWGDVWTPLAVDEAAALQTPLHGFGVLGRLGPRVTAAQARSDLDAIARRLEEELPAWNRGWGVEMHPIRWWITGDVERPLLLLLAAVGLVLLVACANVSGLLLARAAARRGEMALRRALGAGRADLVRQGLIESMLLAGLGGAAGLGLAAAGTELLAAVAPGDLPRLAEVAVDVRVLAATLGTALVAGLASGLVPALHLAGAASSLRDTAVGLPAGRRGRRWYQLLVAAEIAVAVVVVVGSGLLGRSLERLTAVDPGFEADPLLSLRLELPRGAYPDKAQRIGLFRRLLDRLEALPGVEAAAVSGVQLPLVGGQGTFELFVEGHPRGSSPEIVVTAQAVSPGYFRTMGIPLVAGRPFAAGDTWESSHAVIVNQAFARRFWPGGDAVGKWVEWRGGDRGWIVGVSGDVRQLGLHRAAAEELYVPWGLAEADQALVVRTAADPLALAGAVRGVIGEVAPGTAVWGLRSGQDLVTDSYGDRRFTALLLGLFAALALALAAVGTYGVLAQAVHWRRRELGVRMALGARPLGILRLVLGRGMAPVAVGLGLGVAISRAAVRLLESQLFGVAPTDPATFGAAALAITAVALAACALPARRAARIDPAESLRVRRL